MQQDRDSENPSVLTKENDMARFMSMPDTLSLQQILNSMLDFKLNVQLYSISPMWQSVALLLLSGGQG